MSQFKAATKHVDATCRAISETMLLSVERKRLYVNSEFTDEQAKHRVLVRMPSDHKHLSAAQHTPWYSYAKRSVRFGLARPHMIIDLLGIWLQALGRLERAHQSIADTLLHLHTFFAADSDEVQREWARFRDKVPAYLHMYSEIHLAVPIIVLAMQVVDTLAGQQTHLPSHELCVCVPQSYTLG